MNDIKLSFVKASDKIRTEIENAIKDGQLLPGESIDEIELARQHQVSRTPVRDALIQLQAQGMVTSLPRGGVIVAKMDLLQLLALWELLAELEGIAVRLAYQRMTSEERETLVKIHEQSRQHAEADDISGWQKSNMQFHDLIYRATRNPFLRVELMRIRARTGYYRLHAFGALGRIRSSFEQHQVVVDAFREGDQEAAVTAMVLHMRPAADAKGLTDFIVNMPKDLLAK